ncbi:MAG: HEAT repeat domain-containing protein, partial [Anaerolineae bacterium]|nr:HEAT repeat domain-containing protein [Anaerolineae bacterium]
MKLLNEIETEFEVNGRLSKSAIEKLEQLILSDDPYSAITVATDCGIFALAPAIAQTISSQDPMVRWNAIGALLTRFRLSEYAELGFELVLTDPDEMVRD